MNSLNLAILTLALGGCFGLAGTALASSPPPPPPTPAEKLPELIELLDADDPAERANALARMARLESRELLVPLAPRLLELIESEDDWVAGRALSTWLAAPLEEDARMAALATFRRRAASAESTPNPFARALATLKEPGNRALAEIASSTRVPARDLALVALRPRPEYAQFALPVLLATIRDPERWTHHGVAVQKIGRLRGGAVGAVPELSAMLDSPYTPSNLRRTVADSLGQIGDDAAEPALRRALQDPIDDVRRSSRNALGKLQRAGRP